MHTLQHWLPLFPLASPSCLLLWPDEPPLFICYYTASVRSKNQEGLYGECQHRWHESALLCSSSMSGLRSLPALINVRLILGNSHVPESLYSPGFSSLCICGLKDCLHPSTLAGWMPPHLLSAASEGRSAVLMRISLFVLFTCVPP